MSTLLGLLAAAALVTSTSVASAQSGQWDEMKKPGDASSGNTTDGAAASGSGDDAAKSGEGAKPAGPIVEPPKEEEKDTDVEEKPGKTYYFVGLRYRGTVIPKFIENLFVDEGRTIYSNTVGAELDMRKDGFSFIPALQFTEYGMPDTLFLEKNKDANFAGNWSNIHSSLKSIYATADLLWSSHVAKNVDIEYGAGFGVGVLFGDLETSWVYQNPNGPYESSDGRRFAPCNTENDGVGCKKSDHQNSSISKVNHYTEPSWFNGGSKPNFFIHLAIPQFGVRIKPVKQLETRISVGFSLTGFWFGLSANYGLEKALQKKDTTSEQPKDVK